jgi:toxin ParE1/3/4
MAHRLAPEAEHELDQIWDFIAEASGTTEAAGRVIDAIADGFLLLADHPHIGRKRDHDLRAGLRSFPVGDYVIVYRVDRDDVLILHVIHGRRDLSGLIGG